MFEKKEIKYRIKRLAKKFCRRNDVDRRFGSSEENLIVKAYLSAYLLCLHENKHKRTELEKENVELETLIENMQRDVLSLVKDRMNDDVDQNIIERLADKWGLKENDR